MWFAVYHSPTDTEPSLFENYDGTVFLTTVPWAVPWAKVWQQNQSRFYYWNRDTHESTLEKPPQDVVPARSGSAPTSWGPTWDFTLDFAGAKVRHPGGDATDLPPQTTPTPTSNTDWIQVCEGTSYFWQPTTGKVKTALPPGHSVARYVQRRANGRWHCWDPWSQAVAWTFPGLPPTGPPQGTSWMSVGMAVQVTLAASRRFDGCCAKIVEIQETKVMVQLPPDLGCTNLRVPPEFVGPCEPGTWLHLRGSPDPALNNQLCEVISHTFEGCRYIVRLKGDTQHHNVSMMCVEAVQRLRGINYSAPAELALDGEQAGTFIDSRGENRQFKLRFPVDFREEETWPLLVYMHGSGKGSFYKQDGQDITGEGLQFANRHFAVVSPVCEWTWQDEPSAWVSELVQYLAVARWVDPERIYLTGCSMGGMGTWMVGAQNSSLFAAVAPVAAHHDHANTRRIATQLAATDMPICVVHSTKDRTCRRSKEEPLWDLLKASNPQLLIWLSTRLSHGYMNEAAYCKSSRLFEWLLQHRRAW